MAEAAKPPNDAAALGAADEFVLKLKPPADGAVVVTGAAVAPPNAPKLVAVVVVGVARKLKPAVVPTLLALDAGVVDEKLKPVAAGAPAVGAAAGLLLLNAPNSEPLAPAVVAAAAVAVLVTTAAALVPLLNSDGALGALLPTLPKIPVPAPLATLLAVVVTSGTERVAPEPNTNPAVDEKSADAALSLSPSALGAE